MELDELARGCDTNKQLAPAGEQLLGNEHCKRCPNGAGHDAKLEILFGCPKKFGVVAGPPCISVRATGLLEVAHHIAVRVKDADGRYASFGQPLLTPRLLELLPA